MPRPKSFDPEAVLAKAMDVFWEKGYDAASITDLTAAMGINRFSLYDTFGDKHTLYLRALEFYQQSVVSSLIEKIDGISSLEALESFFFRMIEYQHSCTGKCCMVQKAAASIAAADDETRDLLEQIRARCLDAYRGAIERIRDNGELSSDLDPKDSAWMLMILQSGLMGFSSPPIPADDARAAVRLMLTQLRARQRA